MQKKPRTYSPYLVYSGITLFLLLVLLFFSNQNRSGDYSVEITSPREKIVQPIRKEQIISVDGAHGKVMVQIQNRGVKVISSSCPDQICVKAGEIKIPGPMNICAPNRVMVRIIKNNFKPLVTY